MEPDKLSRGLACCALPPSDIRNPRRRPSRSGFNMVTIRSQGRRLGHPICASPSAPPRCRILSCKLFCTAAKDGDLNIASFGQVLMAFAIVSVLGILLQVDAAGGGPDQKADAMPADPATLATIKGAIALARKGEP